MLRADIPFSRDDANRFLPWMIALMCAITALMLCAGLTLGQWVEQQENSFSESITVQVPNQGDRNAQVVRQVRSLLDAAPGAASINALSREDVEKLVEPWLGLGDTVSELPLPAVFEIQRDRNAQLDVEALDRKLRAIASDISIDTRERWVEKFTKLSRTVQLSVFFIAACVVTALAWMMVFTARAAMKLHAGTILLLHGIGADDDYIAKQFQYNALALALRGSLPGTLSAGLIYTLLGVYANSLDLPLLPSSLLSLPHLFMLFLLPVLCCTLIVLAVRSCTLKLLKQLP